MVHPVLNRNSSITGIQTRIPGLHKLSFTSLWRFLSFLRFLSFTSFKSFQNLDKVGDQCIDFSPKLGMQVVRLDSPNRCCVMRAMACMHVGSLWSCGKTWSCMQSTRMTGESNPCDEIYRKLQKMGTQGIVPTYYCLFAGKWRVVLGDPLSPNLHTEGNFPVRFSRRTSKFIGFPKLYRLTSSFLALRKYFDMQIWRQCVMPGVVWWVVWAESPIQI